MRDYGGSRTTSGRVYGCRSCCTRRGATYADTDGCVFHRRSIRHRRTHGWTGGVPADHQTPSPVRMHRDPRTGARVDSGPVDHGGGPWKRQSLHAPPPAARVDTRGPFSPSPPRPSSGPPRRLTPSWRGGGRFVRGSPNTRNEFQVQGDDVGERRGGEGVGTDGRIGHRHSSSQISDGEPRTSGSRVERPLEHRSYLNP